MIRRNSESAADVIRWMQSEAAGLWPAFVGSLSLRRSRCMHENCPVCLSGEQHQSHVLYNGRRFAVYVPEVGAAMLANNLMRIAALLATRSPRRRRAA